MFRQIVVVSVLAASACAFQMGMARSNVMKISMSAEGLVGALAPTGFFDPLNLSGGKDFNAVKKIRESELKHGRIAMVAVLGVFVGESFNPLFDGKITGPAIFQFQQADDLVPFFWTGVLFVTALIEGQNILDGWEPASDTVGKRVANLKDDYINGDLGFDPLGLKPADEESFDNLRTKELQNGRLAMLGIAGIVAQELVDGQTILSHYL